MKKALEAANAAELGDQQVASLRALRADDTERLEAFLKGLNYSSKYLRFGRGDFVPDRELLEKACQIDPRKTIHLVMTSGSDKHEEIVGSIRLKIDREQANGEFNLVVANAWFNSGIDGMLLDGLLDAAREMQLREVYTRVLWGHAGLLDFLAKRDFRIANAPEGDWLKICTFALA